MVLNEHVLQFTFEKHVEVNTRSDSFECHVHHNVQPHVKMVILIHYEPVYVTYTCDFHKCPLISPSCNLGFSTYTPHYSVVISITS